MLPKLMQHHHTITGPIPNVSALTAQGVTNNTLLGNRALIWFCNVKQTEKEKKKIWHAWYRRASFTYLYIYIYICYDSWLFFLAQNRCVALQLVKLSINFLQCHWPQHLVAAELFMSFYKWRYLWKPDWRVPKVAGFLSVPRIRLEYSFRFDNLRCEEEISL